MNNDEAHDRSIGELLEAGYDTADRFAQWLTHSGVKGDAADDAQNVDAWIDYLANESRCAPMEAREYDLRWFMHSWYLRNAEVSESARRALPRSLTRFVEFLAATEGWEPPAWVHTVVSDTDTFSRRRDAWNALPVDDESAWRRAFLRWNDDLDAELDAAALRLPTALGLGVTWAAEAGWLEDGLRRDANTLWQEQRAALLARGYGVDEVRSILTDEFEHWCRTPQDRLDDRTPVEAVQDEQERALDRGEDEDEAATGEDPADEW